MRKRAWVGPGVIVCLLGTAMATYARSVPVCVAKVQKEDVDFMESYRQGDSFEDYYLPSVVASSALRSHGGNHYTPDALLDGNLDTAWAEGARGNGVGEWLEFTFDRRPGQDELPKNDVAVTNFNFFNGYRKSPALWKANGRVRELEVRVNGVPKALLHLIDTPQFQTVTLPKIVLPRQKKTVVRVIIRSVYPGTTYPDTALSELEFGGYGPY